MTGPTNVADAAGGVGPAGRAWAAVQTRAAGTGSCNLAGVPIRFTEVADSIQR